MEGFERQAVERRLECLRNIHGLLEAAMIQIVQYVTVVRQQGMPGFQIPPTFDSTLNVPTSNTATTNKGPTEEPSSSVSPSTEESTQRAATETIPSTLPPQAEASSTNAGDGDGDGDVGEAEPNDADELRRRRLAKLDSFKNASELEDVKENANTDLE